MEDFKSESCTSWMETVLNTENAEWRLELVLHVRSGLDGHCTNIEIMLSGEWNC